MVGQFLLSRSPTAVDSSLSIAALFPASTCHVTTENGGLLKLFGNFLAMAVVLSLLTGKTYYRRLISKNEEPFNFWFTVGCLLVLAVFVLGMLYACPQL
jgi:hypothetical protein